MTFSEMIAAAEAGAAKVYHAVLATAVEIEGWETSPLIAPLIGIGVSEANSLLSRLGVDGAVVTGDITNALKLLAAKDPTIPSLGSLGALAGMVGTIVSTADPALAPVIATVETVASAAESLVVSIVTAAPAPVAPAPAP
jgi:hypothetical protein